MSAYHQFSGEAFGEESRATHWSSFDLERPHHIDYCFVPNTWRVEQVWVGAHQHWAMAKRGSDHAPLVVDVRPADQ